MALLYVQLDTIFSQTSKFVYLCYLREIDRGPNFINSFPVSEVFTLTSEPSRKNKCPRKTNIEGERSGRRNQEIHFHIIKLGQNLS